MEKELSPKETKMGFKTLDWITDEKRKGFFQAGGRTGRKLGQEWMVNFPKRSPP